MLAIWSLVPLPLWNPACTLGSSWFTCCWILSWRILNITLLACEMNTILQQFEHSLALPLFEIGMKTDRFQFYDHCWVFQICWHIDCSTLFYFIFSFISISWRLITLRYCSGFCHTLTWISHGVTCIPHPDPPSHLPVHPIPLGFPSAPGPSTCLMHPTWAGDLFHPW